MAAYLVSHEATVVLVAGPGGSVPASDDIAEVGMSVRGRRPVAATLPGQKTTSFMLGEQDGSGYIDVYVDIATKPPFPDGIEAVLTATFNSIGSPNNSITGIVMFHRMRHAPVGMASVPGKQRVRFDWLGVLE